MGQGVSMVISIKKYQSCDLAFIFYMSVSLLSASNIFTVLKDWLVLVLNEISKDVFLTKKIREISYHIINFREKP